MILNLPSGMERLVIILAASAFANCVSAQTTNENSKGAPVPLSAAIDAATWKRVDAATDRALLWLANGQRRTGYLRSDGCF